MNNFTAIVNLGADPELLNLNGRDVYKLRCADRGVGKNSVTMWFTCMVSGVDTSTCEKLAKGDSIMVGGSLRKTEFKAKKPRYKGEMLEALDIPYGKILQVVKSPTFFNTDVGDFPPPDDDSTTSTEPAVTDTTEPAELAGL